jgi:aldose 1-epimerase
MGAIVGRYANRIANGRYHFEGQTFQISRNEYGSTTLHGGKSGFSKRIWKITDITNHSVTLRLLSLGGDQGFPGILIAQCKYAFSDANEFSIEFSANTDTASPVNLAQHAYFNLDGSADINNHILQIFADKFTPTTPDLIPTGQIVDVTGTAFDFRGGKLLKDTDMSYDCNLVLNTSKALSNPEPAAVLQSKLNGLTMKVSTTKPGLQFYDGHLLAIKNAGKKSVSYGTRAGLCLETQFFPDSPNQPKFPDAILRPGSTYRHVTKLEFSIAEEA